jgi:hypothetical protein
MDFAELMAQLMNPGEEGLSPTIYDDLSAAYTNDTSTRDAKIEVQGNDLAAAQAEILALKAMNYDLLMVAGIDNAPDSVDDDSDTDSDSDSDSDDVGDDDDFFEKKDD